MRGIGALQTCVALLAGFLSAPFQHVHSGSGGDHAGIIHAHLYQVAHDSEQSGVPVFEDSDDDHATAWSTDTFTLVIPAASSPFVLSHGPEIGPVLAASSEHMVTIEQRGHSPPFLHRSNPRAPPF